MAPVRKSGKELLEKELLNKVINMFGKSKKKKYNKDTKKNEKQWVVCPRCNYKGTLEEFLIKDSSDTKCPKCGEDIQRFEL